MNNNIQRKMTGMRQNYKFTDTLLVNDATYIDYLERLKRICLSMFEWVNLPSSMNARWLERTLYYNGKASLLKDKNYGFINTMCSSAGDLNIYGLPTSLGCYGFGYYSQRKLYTGLNPLYTEAQQRARDFYECILVYNNWDPIPTCATIELFALRLYESERSADVNIKGQKYPYVIATDEKQRLFMENLYSQIDGNHPVIFGDKKQLNPDGLYPVISGGCTPMGRYDYYNREGNITTISQYGSAGFVDWQKSKFWANDVCYSLFAKDCVLDKFLYYTMKSKQDLLYELRSTDAIPYCLPIKILQSIV